MYGFMTGWDWDWDWDWICGLWFGVERDCGEVDGIASRQPQFSNFIGFVVRKQRIGGKDKEILQKK
jgi:hypothetical protein